MTNPYKTLDQTAFWAPSVAQRHMMDIDKLWRDPFGIDSSTRIATFGSCFAQHFSQALEMRGFRWFNCEPAPDAMPKELARKFNYNVFSARTANIYTTSLLLQWTKWALGRSKPPEIYWECNGRVFDPFRPTIEPDGFSSVDEMIVSRQTAIRAFRRCLIRCDLFVFTLGLTESWWDTELNFEYPLCPGTAAGNFDASRHVFRNQEYPEIRRALAKVIELVRSARKTGPNFLLTVSPVPLTATNSGNHVLVATNESKSILRAVAGSLAREDEGTSYFPSYEIITAPAYRGSFFEPNMRSVSPHGVNHVMKIFFDGLTEFDSEKAKPVKRSTGAAARRSKDDIICEEELLEAFGSG